MKAGEVVFQRLLDGKIQYMVPLYQRTYNWNEEQWDQLWEDLLEIYAMQVPRNHFIGSVVTQQVPNEPEGVSRYTLIDGQQRMTTLFILLATVRQNAMSDNKDWGRLSEEIQNTCLINEFNDGEERIKFMPTQRDRVAFASVVNGEPAEPSTQIEKARTHFEKLLHAGDVDNNPIDLRKLHGCIVNHLDMVSIHLDREDSPNRIFESLNNTGMPLSVADLIRNYFLMNIVDQQKQERAYNDFWLPMEETLAQSNSSAASNFFWHYLMKDGSLPRKDETYEEIQKRFSRPNQTESIAALSDFAKFARYYAHITQVNVTGLDAALTAQIDRLNQWEVAVAYPFMLRAMDGVASKDIDVIDLIAVLKLVESFLIRRAVCGVPTNQLRRIFAQMSAQVDFARFVETSRNHLLNNRWPNDDEFRSNFTHFPFYSRGRSIRTNLVLWTLERSFGHKETPAATDGITIEHIMPQTLSPDWIVDLGIDPTDVHARWLHTIGNLTLSGYNPNLGNKPFPVKRTALKASNFALNESVVSFYRWDESAIQSRANDLANKAVIIWPRE